MYARGQIGEICRNTCIVTAVFNLNRMKAIQTAMKMRKIERGMETTKRRMKKDQVEHVKHSLQSTIVGVGQISERRDRVEKKSTENFSSFPHSKHTQRSNEITQLAVSGAHSIKRKFLSIKNG